MSASNISGIGMTSQRTRGRLVQWLTEQGVKHNDVLRIMEETPRHLFVDEGLSHRAYENTALPIGDGQTISQPYTVARMTEILLQTGKVDKVLEIGTGCGYQTAVLAKLCKTVFTVERIRQLHMKARKTLSALNLHNIQFLFADGFNGWQQNAPYDGIIVTAAPSQIPESLILQLADGGRLIIPVGSQENEQKLYLIERQGDKVRQTFVENVKFVPLVGGVKR